MAHLNKSIVEVKEEEKCLPHALIISIATWTIDPNYKAYRQGKNTSSCRSFTCDDRYKFGKWRRNPETNEISRTFQRIQDCRFRGLNCDDIVFDGHVESEKRINLLYYGVSKHYDVIGNLTGAMTRKCVCRGCNKGCKSGVTHRCQEMCSDYVRSAMSIRRCPNPMWGM
jgi:hypothetical protein